MCTNSKNINFLYFGDFCPKVCVLRVSARVIIKQSLAVRIMLKFSVSYV